MGHSVFSGLGSVGVPVLVLGVSEALSHDFEKVRRLCGKHYLGNCFWRCIFGNGIVFFVIGRCAIGNGIVFCRERTYGVT